MKKTIDHSANLFDSKKAADYLSKSGIKKEKNDCTVRALSNSFGVDYEKAHMHLTTLGRKVGQGLHFCETFGRKNGNLFGKKYFYYNKPGRTMEKFLEDNPKGTFLVLVRKHATCIKDGKIIDSTTNKPGVRIREFYKLNSPLLTVDRAELLEEVEGMELKGEAVEFLYNEGLNPAEITKMMIKAGHKTTEGSVRCFIRTINNPKTN